MRPENKLEDTRVETVDGLELLRGVYCSSLQDVAASRRRTIASGTKVNSMPPGYERGESGRTFLLTNFSFRLHSVTFSAQNVHRVLHDIRNTGCSRP